MIHIMGISFSMNGQARHPPKLFCMATIANVPLLKRAVDPYKGAMVKVHNQSLLLLLRNSLPGLQSTKMHGTNFHPLLLEGNL